MTAARPVVTITRKLPAEVEAEAARLFGVRTNETDRPFTPAELREALHTSDGLLCTVSDRLDGPALADDGVRARILANYGVGFNHIDLAAAKARGITVTNTPGVLTDATADIAITLMLMVARRAGEGERELRAGRWTGWRPTHLLGTSLKGKTLGIVGMGRIGRAVAERAHAAWKMRVVYASRTELAPEDRAATGARRLELDALLAESDVVSLHVPATPETHHLIDARRLALMKPSAILVNTARGDVVDEAALAAALSAGAIAGAGLDVFEREPVVTPALLTLENVVLLPHLGSADRETRVAMGLRALENLRLFFEGREVRDRVV